MAAFGPQDIRDEFSGWQKMNRKLDNDPKQIRYGCCLSALTGLAKHSPAANFPPQDLGHYALKCKSIAVLLRGG